MDIFYYADHRGKQPVDEWLRKIKKREPEVYRKTIIMFSYLDEKW